MAAANALDMALAGAALPQGAAAALSEPVAVDAQAAVAIALIGGLFDPTAGRVAALQQQEREIAAHRRQLKVQKDDVARKIKNEKRKRKRMMDKAKGLSDAELVAVLGARTAAKAKPKAKARAKAKAKAVADAVAPDVGAE